VPNAQLIKDKDEIAVKFNNKSVAEQNSVHLGWEMLMDPRFERLRKSIYTTNVERKRFRQLVINAVLATDIADREVNENRKIKWEKAFRSTPPVDPSPLQIQEDMNRKGTAVIEQIIQVSDVAHTMQHVSKYFVFTLMISSDIAHICVGLTFSSTVVCFVFVFCSGIFTAVGMNVCSTRCMMHTNQDVCRLTRLPTGTLVSLVSLIII
jgi:3'5'-cyclic nucleotide phosphodiesterase